MIRLDGIGYVVETCWSEEPDTMGSVVVTVVLVCCCVFVFL